MMEKRRQLQHLQQKLWCVPMSAIDHRALLLQFNVCWDKLFSGEFVAAVWSPRSIS